MPERWYWLSFGFWREVIFNPVTLLHLDHYNSRKQCADLGQVKLMDADLSRANLTEADLRGASLKGATLRASSLKAADLESANLAGADLRNSNFEDADFKNSVLLLADLRHTGQQPEGFLPLQGEDLENAKVCLSILPVELSDQISRDCGWIQENWHRKYYPDLYARLEQAEFQRKGWNQANAEATRVSWSELDGRSQFCAALQTQLPSDFERYYDHYRDRIAPPSDTETVTEPPAAKDPAYCDLFKPVQPND